jgi:hypothetical protein
MYVDTKGLGMEKSTEIDLRWRSLRERLGTLEARTAALTESFADLSRAVASSQILLWVRLATQTLEAEGKPSDEQSIERVHEWAHYYPDKLGRSRKPMEEVNAFAQEIHDLLDNRRALS